LSFKTTKKFYGTTYNFLEHKPPAISYKLTIRIHKLHPTDLDDEAFKGEKNKLKPRGFAYRPFSSNYSAKWTVVVRMQRTLQYNQTFAYTCTT
jgi:hypothetical protein